MQLCHPLLNIDLKGDTIRISQTFKKCFEEKTKLLSSQCLSMKSFMQEKGTKWKRETSFFKNSCISNLILRSSSFFWVCRLKKKDDATSDLHQDFGWIDTCPIHFLPLHSWMIRVCYAWVFTPIRLQWCSKTPATTEIFAKKSGSNSSSKIFQTFCKWPTPPKKTPQHKLPKHPFWCLPRFLLMSFHLKTKSSKKTPRVRRVGRGLVAWYHGLGLVPLHRGSRKRPSCYAPHLRQMGWKMVMVVDA